MVVIIWKLFYVKTIQFCYPWSQRYFTVHCPHVLKAAFNGLLSVNPQNNFCWRSYVFCKRVWCKEEIWYLQLTFSSTYINSVIGETFCTVLLFTLDEQYFLYIKITIIILLRQGILILPFLMKFDLGEIYFIKETRTRNLISKKIQTFLANISWHKNW